jgi:hypothetical protein
MSQVDINRELEFNVYNLQIKIVHYNFTISFGVLSVSKLRELSLPLEYQDLAAKANPKIKVIQHFQLWDQQECQTHSLTLWLMGSFI